MDYNKHNGVEHCVVYSLTNETFVNNTLNLIIKDGALLDIEEIKIIAGDTSGKELKNRWLTAEINNFKISSI